MGGAGGRADRAAGAVARWDRRAAGSDHERRHLLFRDHLRADAADRDLYAAAKRELAARDWDDMNDYAQAKDDVIAQITARGEAWAAASGWRLTA